MEETKYKLLKDYGDFLAGEIITEEEVLETDEVEVLLEDGVLELVIDEDINVDDSTPADDTPESGPEVEGESEAKVYGDPDVKAKYKVLGAIDIKDGSAQKQGEYNIGTVYEFPEDTGNMYVDQGLAERVEE